MPKTKAPELTHQEVLYLNHLVKERVRVCIKLISGELVSGFVEFYDAGFLRLTRDEGPNLFVYKHEIKYIYESPEV